MSSPSSPARLKITLAVVAVLLLVVIGVFLRGSGPSPEPVETPKNVVVEATPKPPPTEVVSATPAPTPAPVERGPNDEPAPSPIPAADPMAEFRVPRFSGKVLDGKTYKGLANARVVAYMFEEGNFNVAPGYPSVMDEVVSGPTGDFQFSERPVGRGEVLAWHATLEGYTSMMLLFPAGEGLGDKLRSHFLLQPGGLIAGMVVDEAGKPIAGATVGDMIVGNFQRPGTPGENTVPSVHTTTDLEGKFRLVGLEVGKKMPIPVRAKGFVDYLSDPPLEVGREDVVIKLTKSDASLRGRVVDWDKSGARGVKVSLRAISTRVPLPSPLFRNTTTGSDGGFDFPGLISGEYQIAAELDVPDSLGPGCRVDTNLTILLNEAKRVELQLPAPARIEGRFVDPETGKGVAKVRLFRLIDEVQARERAFSVESDSSGAFAFTAFVPADQRGYEVRLPVIWGEEWFPLPNDKQPDNVRVDQDVLSFMSVAPGEKRVDVEVAMGPGAVVSGVVIEPDGSTPAVDVPVYFRSERHFAAINTDTEGKFSVALPIGLAIRLESSTEKGIAGMAIRTTKQNPPLRLVLGAYGTLIGDLKDSEGAPLGEIVVAVHREPGTGFKDAIRFEEKGMTRGDGSWRIDNVAPGSLGLLPELSTAADFAPPTPLNVELTAGEELTDLHIVLQAGDYIDGQVVDDSTGKPISGVTIFTTMREVSAQSDAEGRFRLSGIPYDRALEEVTASIAGYGEEVRSNVSIYDKELMFRLKPQVELEVRAVDGGGQPIPSYRLRVLAFRSDTPGNSGQEIREVSVNNTSGVYALGNLQSGVYRAEVVELTSDGSSNRTGAEDFIVASGGEPKKTILVQLVGNLFITGTVVTAGTDAPVSGAEVELLNPPINLITAPRGPDSRGYITTADSGGRFSIGPVAAGVYQLRAAHQGSASAVVPIVLSADSQPVTLPIEARPVLYGALLAPDGSPVRRANIFILNTAGVPSGGPQIASGGSYEISLPTAGSWQVVFSQDDTPNVMTRSVALTAGERQQLDIDFSSRVTLTGRLIVNGAPAASNLAILLRATNGEEVLAVPSGASGSYTVELSPGTYSLHYSSGQVTAPTYAQITVESTPASQQRDLAVQIGALDLVVVAADGASINGELTLESQSPQGGTTTVLQGYRVDRVSMRFLQLPAGAYRGTLNRDGSPVSTSAWIQVPQGGSGTMTLDWK